MQGRQPVSLEFVLVQFAFSLEVEDETESKNK